MTTAIASARRASTAARTANAEAKGAQTELELTQLNIQSFDAQAKSLKAALNFELQKSPQNPAQIQNLRNGIATLDGLRDAEKAKLPALKQKVTDGTKKQGEAAAAAIGEERKILKVKEDLQKDQFSTKKTADSKRLMGTGFGMTADALGMVERSLKEKLRQPGLSRDEKRELKAQIAALQKGQATFEKLDRNMERSARGDDAKVRQLDRKLEKLEPSAAEAEKLLKQDVTDLVTTAGGAITTQVKAAVTEAEEKANGAGSIAQVDAVLGSKNADRAMNAWQRIDKVANGSAEAKARLTPEVRDMLVQGVANSRTNDALGQEGILTQAQAEKAAKALAAMPKERYEQVMTLLAKAGGPTGDAQTERALILKAVAARSDALTSTGAYSMARSIGAVGELMSFAGDIRGEQKDKLIRSTSPIDLDGSTNDSTVSPDGLRWAGSDTATNNDGRFQKFDTTCVPTTGQIVREESDPVAARRMSKDGVGNADPATAAATQQKEVLDAHDSPTSSRRASQTWGRAMGIAKGLKFSELELKVLDQALRGRPDAFGPFFDGEKLLKKVQAADGGMPGATELGWIKKELTQTPEGMSVLDGLNEVASGALGYEYKSLSPAGTVNAAWTDGAGAAQTTSMSVPSGADFAVWDSRLKDGDDVPLRITDSGGNNGHAITITDVRNQPDTQYLISDPWSGVTAWVKQSDIAQGLDANGKSWISKNFPGLGWDRISDYFVEK